MKLCLFIRLSLAAGCLILGAINSVAAASAPNLVYILADDLGYGDVRCLNPESKIPTPNLDRLAAEGLTFIDAHSGSSVCTPTRYGVLTGRYCWRSRLKQGVLGGFSPHLIEEGRLTVPALLQSNGYHTAAIGKWHLGMDWPAREAAGFGDDIKPKGKIQQIDYTKSIRRGPISVGFDYYFGISASLDMPPYIFIENDRTLGLPTATKKWIREGPAHPDFEAVDVLKKLTERATRYLRERADDSAQRRFFLYLALNSPHTPVVPRPEFAGKGVIGKYGDFVAETDWAVGQVLRALQETGLERETLVIFTSDNGATPSAESGEAMKAGHRANGSWRGTKSDIWEGGHRIPFFARWPGRTPAGAQSSDTICLTSLLATCADLLGVKLPPAAGEDSFSIAPWLRGESPSQSTHEAVVHHSIKGMFAVRQGPWKFIDGQGSGGWSKGGVGTNEPPGQLYHLGRDPGETSNLYRQHPEVVEKLTALLRRIQTGDRSHSGR